MDSREEHSCRKSSPMRVRLDREDIFEIVFRDEQSSKNPAFNSVTFVKQDKSTDSKDEHPHRKSSPMVVTFDKAGMLDIVFKEEHPRKKPPSIAVAFAMNDKSTDSKDEHSPKK
eukprot:TRINITY_DN6419_c1_g1_i1.p2 TRINITY_DN6419_c1_g1~~TRINITY_DN6419_c1_g1_i1.p2  ORF type:complete len:114 (-),score=16.09 TRINITY_DN6419_c1_g1_i1:274-615(-)